MCNLKLMSFWDDFWLQPSTILVPPSGLIVHEGAAVYSVFLRWRAVNLHWDVQSYDKAKDMEEASAGHSTLAPRTLWLPLVSFGPNGSLQATQLGPQSWTRLCLGQFCSRTNTVQDNESGEVVIRVTSVWGDTLWSRCSLILTSSLSTVEFVFSGAGPQTLLTSKQTLWLSFSKSTKNILS